MPDGLISIKDVKEMISRQTGLVAVCFLLLGLVAGHLLTGNNHQPSSQISSATGETEKSESGKERNIKYWIAPMDPSYIRNEPGKSPMGMDLVPVYEDEVDDSKMITINPSVVQNMGVRIVEAKEGPLHKVIRAVGHVDYDETKVFVVSLKLNGWIENLYADTTGQLIEKGDKLFDIYSPQLVSAQQDFLLESRRKKTKRSFQTESRTRLTYFDIEDSVIDELIERGKPEKTLPIYSKYSGILVKKNIFEGEKVSAGKTIFQIADLSKVWVYVHLYESEIAWVKEGQMAIMTLPYHPGKEFRGKVTYIYPYVDKKTRDIQIRLEFENPKLELKPDMFVNVEIHSELKKKVTLVPEEAVLRSGKRQLVYKYLGEKGHFLPVDVESGLESMDGYVEILKGVQPGDRIVSSGQFMIDSESKLKEAIQKMLKADITKPVNEEYQPTMEHDMEEGTGTMEPQDSETGGEMEHDMEEVSGTTESGTSDVGDRMEHGNEDGNRPLDPEARVLPTRDDAVYMEESG